MNSDDFKCITAGNEQNMKSVQNYTSFMFCTFPIILEAENIFLVVTSILIWNIFVLTLRTGFWSKFDISRPLNSTLNPLLTIYLCTFGQNSATGLEESVWTWLIYTVLIGL